MGVPTTKTSVKALLAAHGLHPRRLKGQHFLLDPNLVAAIAAEAEPKKTDCILEVGTGTGVLTWRLAEKAGCVVSCDIDGRLQAVAQGAADWPEHVVFLQDDILAGKHRLSPGVMDVWQGERGRRGLKDLLVVSNLPYSVATPFLMNLLWDAVGCRDIVVLVQKEVAERFTAAVGTAEYGAVSIVAALLARPRILRSVGPQVFWPRPKVQSALLRLTPEDPDRARALRERGLPELLHDAFLHRRKTLRKRLGAKRLEGAGLPIGVRPQEVEPEGWVRLLASDS
ncbi:MAG: 16S rRNA (adenine(1518)-N(6)/adenine(1519)-N(6))-dimethyltransferase RsmA [Planctomycetota bacterium]|nr:16S rRNA (adenine(1518)-N(6)/adenine(1519)-N(6))-dimethyltransferase RsmA [Planctomycetota bacterium]